MKLFMVATKDGLKWGRLFGSRREAKRTADYDNEMEEDKPYRVYRVTVTVHKAKRR